MRRSLIVASTLIVCGLAAGAVRAESAPPQQTQPDQQDQADKSMNSPSGRAGKDEPGSYAPSAADASVLRNGALNVPGAPTDSQTVPAKFSKRNAALDQLPTLAFPLALNDDQKRAIRDSVRAAAKPAVGIKAAIAQELSITVPVYDLPDAALAAAPNLRGLKYVPLQDKILLVYAPNMIVVGEIGAT